MPRPFHCSADFRSGSFSARGRSRGRSCAGEVGAAVVGQPFNGDWQAIDPAEAMLNGRHHQVAHVFAADAGHGGEKAHGLTVAAIESNDADLVAVVAADLEAVGAPSPVRLVHGNAAVLSPLDAS